MDALWVDENGFPWFPSDDPAAEAECEVPDGVGGALLVKRLRRGFAREELRPDPDGRLVVMRAVDVDSAWSLADLLAARLRLAGELEPEVWFDADRVARRLGISRDTLDRIVADAPKDLPGAPVDIGEGRRSYRWRVDDVDAWFAAYGRWRQGGLKSATTTRGSVGRASTSSVGKLTRAEVAARRARKG